MTDEKELWILLNAEQQIEEDKNSIYSNRLNVRTLETALKIAEVQYEMSIIHYGKLTKSVDDYINDGISPTAIRIKRERNIDNILK